MRDTLALMRYMCRAFSLMHCPHHHSVLYPFLPLQPQPCLPFRLDLPVQLRHSHRTYEVFKHPMVNFKFLILAVVRFVSETDGKMKERQMFVKDIFRKLLLKCENQLHSNCE